MFDFSNYPKNSKFFDEANKKVIGKMKDESEGKIIDGFVGLKPKMWLGLMNLKTICSTWQYWHIKWEEFKVKKHKLGTHEIDKKPLSCFDNKRSF